jgi:uncharacterized protein (DUF1697 family)
VQTYIQSGNVFVTTEEENAAKVGFIIKQELFKVFGGCAGNHSQCGRSGSLFHL